MSEKWRHVLGHRTVVTTVLLLSLAGVFELWSFVDGARKYTGDEIPAGVETTDVMVEFDFKLEQFHMQLMQNTGNILKVDGSRVYLRSADISRLRKIARHYWVRDIRPFDVRDDNG